MTTLPTTEAKLDNANPNVPEIPLHDRFMLWLFLVVFVVFGLILLCDLFAGLLR